MTEKTATPAEITRWRKRIRQHLNEIEHWRMDVGDPLPALDGVLDDDVLDELAARILDDLRESEPQPVSVGDGTAALDRLLRFAGTDAAIAEVTRLREIEQPAREYVEAVDRGRQLGVANLGRPILQFQPLRAALGIGPFLGDDDV